MRPKLTFSSLKEGRWYEYVVRFMLGGAVTVLAGAIGGRFGPSVGGLLLAFPAILCASATLIEKHEIRRKREAGLVGVRRGQQAAALDVAGAALGSFGMLAFAISFSWQVQRNVLLAFAMASAAWAAVAISAWWAWRHFRLAGRHTRCRHCHAVMKEPLNRPPAKVRIRHPA
jgi:hypothetical protein